jgi:HPt (histidine-containing phosphotransfer) domain-containing protein
MTEVLLNNSMIDEAQKLMGKKFPIIVRYYLEDTESYIKQLHQHLTENDPVSMVAVAHSIKSSSKQLGIIQLAQIAEDIEQHANHYDMEKTVKRLQYVFEQTKSSLVTLCGIS